MLGERDRLVLVGTGLVVAEAGEELETVAAGRDLRHPAGRGADGGGAGPDDRLSDLPRRARLGELRRRLLEPGERRLRPLPRDGGGEDVRDGAKVQHVGRRVVADPGVVHREHAERAVDASADRDGGSTHDPMARQVLRGGEPGLRRRGPARPWALGRGRRAPAASRNPVGRHGSRRGASRPRRRSEARSPPRAGSPPARVPTIFAASATASSSSFSAVVPVRARRPSSATEASRSICPSSSRSRSSDCSTPSPPPEALRSVAARFVRRSGESSGSGWVRSPSRGPSSRLRRGPESCTGTRRSPWS